MNFIVKVINEIILNNCGVRFLEVSKEGLVLLYILISKFVLPTITYISSLSDFYVATFTLQISLKVISGR